MNLKWYLIAVLFLLILIYEYVRHVLMEGHSILSIVPSILYYVVIIVPLVLWVFSKLEKHEKELADREKRLRDFLESTRDAVFETDSKGYFTFMNQAGAEMCALASPEEVLGRHATEFWADPSQREAYLAELKEKGYVAQYSVRVRRANGEPAYWDLTSNALKDEEGNFVGIRGICRDVTQRKKLDEQLSEYAEKLEQKVEERTRELSESEKNYRSLFERANDSIFIIELESGRFLDVNQKAADLTGYGKEELLSKGMKDIRSKRHLKRAIERFEEVIKTGSATFDDVPVLRADRRMVDVEISAKIVEYGGRKVVQSIVRDITERKKLEEEIKQHHEELEAYASQLEHSNKLKDLFTDIMRHDLQNPVTVIKGFSELLLDESLGKYRRDVDTIRMNAEKLEGMIESASKYAKLESEEELDFQELDLNETMREVIRSFKHPLEEKKMKLEYKTKGKKPALVNPIIEDVFTNLLSNAIKYSPMGSVIVIEVEDMDRDWRIAVKDRGGGIPDESKEAVFDRFIRVNKGSVKGMGLGLAIVKRIVELHKGRVWVEDNPEGGSIFYVEIPKSG